MTADRTASTVGPVDWEGEHWVQVLGTITTVAGLVVIAPHQAGRTGRSIWNAIRDVVDVLVMIPAAIAAFVVLVLNRDIVRSSPAP